MASRAPKRRRRRLRQTRRTRPSPRLAQLRLSAEEFFLRCGRLRKAIYTEPAFLARVREVIASCGFDPSTTAFDDATAAFRREDCLSHK